MGLFDYKKGKENDGNVVDFTQEMVNNKKKTGKFFDMTEKFSGRITQMQVEYEDRIFVVKKMSALEGIAVLKTLLTSALPIDLLSGLFDENEKMQQIFSSMPTQKKEMSEDDFVLFQKRLLKNVYENNPQGMTRIVDSVGNIIALDVEDNMFLIMFLLAKVVEVNYRDFFIEALQRLGLLEELSKAKDEMMESITQ